VDQFDEISRALEAHPLKAQILLEVEDQGNTLEEVLGILEAREIGPIEYEVLLQGKPSLVLFYLSTNDMREAVLVLTEAGFAKLKGINSKEGNIVVQSAP